VSRNAVIANGFVLRVRQFQRKLDCPVLAGHVVWLISESRRRALIVRYGIINLVRTFARIKQQRVNVPETRARPFMAGIGQLVAMGVERGRKTRPDLKCGICGEHGGDPNSVKFCHRVGLDYVSCSPFRVPIARLAAAQAAVETPRKPVKKVAKKK